MQLHDMTQDADHDEAIGPSYGPCLYLCENDLQNLGIEKGFDDFEPGEVVHVILIAKVSGISAREYGRSVDLQITQMGLSFEADDEKEEAKKSIGKSIYGD